MVVAYESLSERACFVSTVRVGRSTLFPTTEKGNGSRICTPCPLREFAKDELMTSKTLTNHRDLVSILHALYLLTVLIDIFKWLGVVHSEHAQKPFASPHVLIPHGTENKTRAASKITFVLREIFRHWMYVPPQQFTDFCQATIKYKFWEVKQCWSGTSESNKLSKKFLEVHPTCSYPPPPLRPDFLRFKLKIFSVQKQSGNVLR